jgi:hypothetical protein
LAAAGHQIADVRGVDGVKRVLFFGIGEWDAERASAGEREVIGVARVLFRVEVRQGRAFVPEAVQVRRLLGVADDLAVVLVLEVEEKDVLIAGDVGRGGRQRCRGRGRPIKGQADIGGGRVVISGLRRVGAVPVGAGGLVN